MKNPDMNVAALDTHRLVKRLVMAGVSDEQAVKAELKAEIQSVRFGFIAVKVDLEAKMAAMEARHDARTESRFAAMGGKLSTMRNEMPEDKVDLPKWVVGLLLGQRGAVVTLMRLLPGGH